MNRIANNETFLRKLVKAKKPKALKLLKNSSEEELKSVVEVLVNAKNYLAKDQLKQCKIKKFVTKIFSKNQHGKKC